MLKLSNLALRRGARLLFEGVSFTIHRGQKVGITGANGTGKSSLFTLIRGKLHTDSGDLHLPPDMTIAHVAQETRPVSTPALDYVMDGDTQLRKVQDALNQAEINKDGHRQAELHDQLASIDGYTARSRAARLMHGRRDALNFTYENPNSKQIPIHCQESKPR